MQRPSSFWCRKVGPSECGKQCLGFLQLNPGTMCQPLSGRNFRLIAPGKIAPLTPNSTIGSWLLDNGQDPRRLLLDAVGFQVILIQKPRTKRSSKGCSNPEKKLVWKLLDVALFKLLWLVRVPSRCCITVLSITRKYYHVASTLHSKLQPN